MTAPVDPPLSGLAELVARVAQTLQAGDDGAARARAVAEVEQLQAAVGQAGHAAPAGIELGPLAEALGLIAGWLHAPTSERRAEAERAIAALQMTMGSLIGRDPAREDAARRAKYRQEARAALDQIFGGKREKPDC